MNFVAPDEIEAASFAAPETVMQTHDPDDGGWRTWLAGRPIFLEPVQVHLAGAWRSATLLNWGVALGIDGTLDGTDLVAGRDGVTIVDDGAGPPDDGYLTMCVTIAKAVQD